MPYVRKSRSGSHAPTELKGRIRETYPALGRSWGNWFAGLVCGEGCFSMRYPKGRGRRYPAPTFTMAFRDDNAVMVAEIKERLGFGGVYRYGRQGGPKRYITFEVATKEGCKVLCHIFDRFPLRGKAGQVYVIWRQAVKLWQYKANLQSEEGAAAMWSLEAQLKSMHAYNS